MKNASFDDVYNSMVQLEQIDARLIDKQYRLIAQEKVEQKQEASEAALEFREYELKVATKYRPKKLVRKG
jgi:N-acetylmuramic acid 6-phosphate (MurNAc-6-P) etherase